MLRYPLILIFLSLSLNDAYAQSPTVWNKNAENELTRALNMKLIEKKSKNVIFVIGDGMGISTLTTARIFKGEQTNTDGERNVLSFEDLDHVGLVKTYNVDRLVSDSAGTATAFSSGIKTKFGVVGLDERVTRGSCSSFNMSYAHKSFAQYAMEAGKSVGIVTTTRITHATPAATYSYTVERNWESDSDIEREVPAANLRRQCPEDIASQMLKNGINFNVILGGGRSKFLMKNETDPQNSTLRGTRNDRNLITAWKNEQTKLRRRHQYISTGAELRNTNARDTDYLLGLFSYSHMDFESQRVANGRIQPSLKEMVDKALEILQKNDKGYVLYIEAGRIDHAHHGTLGKLALSDTLALDTAMTDVIKTVNLQETLVMVTADHSHVFTFGAYHKKGVPLFGVMESLALDKKAYTSLQYANGPSAPNNIVRPNVTGNTQSETYRQQAVIPLGSETHSGEDVGVYASGPFAHLIHGVHEQSYLAHVVMYSACLGQYRNNPDCPVSGSLHPTPTMSLISLLIIVSVMRRLFC